MKNDDNIIDLDSHRHPDELADIAETRLRDGLRELLDEVRQLRADAIPLSDYLADVPRERVTSRRPRSQRKSSKR